MCNQPRGWLGGVVVEYDVEQVGGATLCVVSGEEPGGGDTEGGRWEMGDGRWESA